MSSPLTNRQRSYSSNQQLEVLIDKSGSESSIQSSKRRIKFKDIQGIAQDLKAQSIKVLYSHQLVPTLTANPQLRELLFLGNKINAAGRKMNPDDVIPFADALKIHKSLTKIDLSGTFIGTLDIAPIAGVLKVNGLITSLNLNLNPMGSEGANRLAEALMSNTTLTALSLRDTMMMGEGVISLAEALTKNSTLKTLDLGNNKAINQINVEPAIKLAEALKVNVSLETLILDHCEFISREADRFSEALMSNTTLKNFDLSHNNINQNYAIIILDRFKMHPFLLNFKLNNDVIEEKTLNEFELVSDRNIHNRNLRQLTLKERCSKILEPQFFTDQFVTKPQKRR